MVDNRRIKFDGRKVCHLAAIVGGSATHEGRVGDDSQVARFEVSRQGAQPSSFLVVVSVASPPPPPQSQILNRRTQRPLKMAARPCDASTPR